MTINECIKKTIEYLDDVYKDGPRFSGKSENEQYEELAGTYAYRLNENLRTLGYAYGIGIHDGVYFNEHGWLALPDFPEEKIETFESSSWKGKEITNGDGFRFKIGEHRGWWYSGGEGSVGNGSQGFGSNISFYERFRSREEAISFEINRMRHYLNNYLVYASTSKMNKELDEIEASLLQPTLL